MWILEYLGGIVVTYVVIHLVGSLFHHEEEQEEDAEVLKPAKLSVRTPPKITKSKLPDDLSNLSKEEILEILKHNDISVASKKVD